MSQKIFQKKAKIISNNNIVKNYFKIILNAPEIASSAKPGQFIEVKVSDNYVPLLRRPLGVHSVNGSRLAILYEVVGKGTALLAQKMLGETIDIIGPLGNGFSYQSPILVAGGMGVAPLVFLAQRLAKRYPLNATALIGAKTKSHILCEREFKQFGCKVKIATDDGSRGFKGKVTDLLKRFAGLPVSGLAGSSPLTRSPAHLFTIYACGPQPMLKEISVISKQYNIPAQVSLEAHMACGFGACLGCVINTKSGYQRVCKEGPVFDAQEIIW